MMQARSLLGRRLLKSHPADAAGVLEPLPAAEAAAFLAEVEPDIASGVLRRMAPVSAASCLAALPDEPAAALLAALPVDAASLLLRGIDPADQDRILTAAGSRVVAALEPLLRYPAGSAGALMDPKVLALPMGLGRREAQARVRRTPGSAFYYVYVIDREQKLRGVLSLRELLSVGTDSSIESVMHTDVSSLPATAGRTAILAHPGWSNVHALPVVDESGRFLGVLRYETLRWLESQPGQASGRPDALGAVLGLAEVIWVGWVAALDGFTMLFLGGARGDASKEERDERG